MADAPKAIGVVLADAVAAAINAATWPRTFTAKRVYHIHYRIEELTDTKGDDGQVVKDSGLKVSVQPGPFNTEPLTRAKEQIAYDIHVAVQKKVADDSEADDLMALVEAIGGLFKFQPQLASTGAVWAGSRRDPLYEPKHMDRQVFTGVVTMTFKMLR